MEDVFKDAQPLKRLEVKRQQWKEHWQVDTSEQVLEDFEVARELRLYEGSSPVTRQVQVWEWLASIQRVSFALTRRNVWKFCVLVKC